MAVIRSTSRSVLAGLMVVAGLALAGCGSGQVAQTADQQGTTDGVNVQVGQLAIRNIALEYPNEGVYPKGSTARLRMVVVNQGNTGDALTDVRSPAASDVTITDSSATASPGAGSASDTSSPSASASPSDSASVSGSASPPGSASPSGGASPSGSGAANPSESATPTQAANAQVTIPPNGYVPFDGGGASVQLTGLVDQLYPAQTLRVTLVFQNAGSVTTTIAVGVPEGEVSLAPRATTAEGG